MKKLASFMIIAMVLAVSISVLFNISSSEKLPSEGNFLENAEAAISENLPFRRELSKLMGGIRYLSGVRHFDNIYIGSEGSLLREIERPTSRNFSAAKNYILSFAEKNQLKPYFMLVPTSVSILQQEIDSYAIKDIFQTLYDHRDEYIYYHTEDIPTSLGGYYIYGELCSRLGLEQNTMDKFAAAYVARGFYGSLATDFFKPYASSDFISLYEYVGEKSNFIIERKFNNGTSRISEDIFIRNENAYENKTDMIFGGMAPVMEITSSETSEEKASILIFGDESAKSWLPFLISNYERITFVELDSASEALLSSVSAKEYDQVLFAYSTAFFSEGIDFEKLEYIGE